VKTARERTANDYVSGHVVAREQKEFRKTGQKLLEIIRSMLRKPCSAVAFVGLSRNFIGNVPAGMPGAEFPPAIGKTGIFEKSRAKADHFCKLVS
jgi:hypothetical protein